MTPEAVFSHPLFTFLALLVWGGMVLGEHWADLKHELKGLDYLVAALIVAAVGLFIWRHVRRP